MMRFVVLFVFCLAVSGVASDYVDPYNVVNTNNTPQSTQQIHSVYYEPELRRSQQEKPCPIHSQSKDAQVDALSVQNVNPAQNKENPQRSAQQPQSQKVNSPSNYGYNLNQNANVADLTSGNERAANNQQNKVNSASPYEPSVNVDNLSNQGNMRNAANPTKAKNTANVASTVNAANQVKQSESPLYFYNDVEHQNSANVVQQYKTQNVPNQYQSKQVRSEKPSNTPYYAFDDDESTSAPQLENHRLNKGQRQLKNTAIKVKNCQPVAGNSQSDEQDQDKTGEGEFYAFVNNKQNKNVKEQNAQNRKGNQQYNNNQAHVFGQPENYEEGDEPQNVPGVNNQNKQHRQVAKNQVGQVSNQAENKQALQQQNNYGNNQDENVDGVDNVDNRNAFAEYDNTEYEQLTDNTRRRQELQQKLRQQKNKAPVNEVDNSNEVKPDDDDYEEDVNYTPSRRNNHQLLQNQPQGVYKNNQVQNLKNNEEVQRTQVQPVQKQETGVEEVDVTARTGRGQKVLIGENTRVCYACSSASNPTCRNPNRHTTVKYCRRGHDSCVTKVFKANGIEILTRDCGTTCNDNVIPRVTPTYAKCSVCHTDLCNGAFSLSGQNVFFICSLAVVAITKYFM